MADAPISEELSVLRRRARRRLVGAVALVLVALVFLWAVMDDKPPQSLTGQPVTIVSSEPSLVATVSPVPQGSKPLATPTPATPAVVPPVQSTPAAQAAVTPPTAQPTPAVKPAMPAAVAVTPNKPEPAPEAKPATHADAKPQPTAKKPEPAASTPAKDVKKDKPHGDPAKILAGMDDLAAPSHAKPAATDDSAKFYVQLGAFADHDKANGLVSKASAAGVSVKHETVKTDKGELYRLRAGPYGSKDEATRAHDRLASAGITSSVVGK
ncbi:MAG: SPOR domain-containing protein [Burkholderiales bacterium]|nr:SPOR domain-containing protein [Burkholderiales bacterium]